MRKIVFVFCRKAVVLSGMEDQLDRVADSGWLGMMFRHKRA